MIPIKLVTLLVAFSLVDYGLGHMTLELGKSLASTPMESTKYFLIQMTSRI